MADQRYEALAYNPLPAAINLLKDATNFLKNTDFKEMTREQYDNCVTLLGLCNTYRAEFGGKLTD